MTEPAGEPDLPELGVHLLVGNDILTKAYNLHRNLDEERVSLIETVAIKPVKSVIGNYNHGSGNYRRRLRTYRHNIALYRAQSSSAFRVITCSRC